jgi:hypothetical protein
MASLPKGARVFARFLSVAFLIFTANAAKAQDPMTLPAGQVGKSYSAEIKAEGGLLPLTWRVSGGELPPGLTVSSAGKLEGTPTLARRDPYVIDLSASDSSQPAQTALQRFSIVIAAAPLRITGVSQAAQLKIVGVKNPASAETVDPIANAAIIRGSQDPPPATPTAPTPQKLPDAPAPTADGSPSGKDHGANKFVGKESLSDKPDTPDKSKTKTPSLACWKDATTVGSCGGPLLRTIVGFEQAGVSAAQSKQNFFFDLLYDRPVGVDRDYDLGPKLRSWGDLRISSVPQQITTSVATFASTFAQQVGDIKVNQVAQSFEFLGGVEYRLYPLNPKSKESRLKDLGYATSPPSKKDQREMISFNLIAGGGVITPLTPQDSVQIFNVPSNQPDFFKQYPQAIGKQFVAFTLPDRNRFFRQAYAGFRLKSRLLGDPNGVHLPETFDITYGFNESITGGRIRGGVMRLEGFVPIPIGPSSLVYLFGTGMFKPGAHALTNSPFLLEAAPTGTLPSDPNAVVITTPQADRDYYRIGVGVDLVNLIKAFPKKSPKDTTASSTDDPDAPSPAPAAGGGNQP